MNWIALSLAGILEIVWAYTMKQSHGFTRPVERVVTIVAMIASFALLAFAMKSLPMGTAYGVWTGIGAVGAFVVGVVVLGEPATTLRLASVALVVAGIAGLKLASG
jgi:quaternary ammonium compound-resistance protein SugE